MKNKGFSLVELIVVIAIMAILVGVAVPVYTGYIQDAKEIKDAQYLDEISRAAQLFAAQKGFELGSVWVAPVITESEGILLYDKQGNYYDGSLSELYTIVGSYNFETFDNDTPVYITPDVQPIPPEDSSAEHTHHGQAVPATCVSNGYTVCEEAGCGIKFDIQPSTGHNIVEESHGIMHILRCQNCDYVKVNFDGNQLGGQ